MGVILPASQAFSSGLRNAPVCFVGIGFPLLAVCSSYSSGGKPAPRLASRSIRRASGTNFVRHAG